VPEEPQPTDWAYAAGLVDGEGCIAIVRSFEADRGRYQYGVQVVVSNRDREVLDWMRSLWGGWTVAIVGKGNVRSSWDWRCPTGLEAKPFLSGIRPWLRIKSRQCDNAVVMVDLLQRGRRTLGRAPLPQAWLDEQEKHYWIQRELNHRGTTPFVRRPMHSPRQISRQRAVEATNGV
jgi:hypothetical protein